MSLREEMHSLVGQITSTREMRSDSLSSIRQEVVRQRDGGRQFVHQLHQGHQRMARELRSNLTRVRRGLDQGETQRKSGVQGYMGGVARDRGAAHTEWLTMFGTRHGEKNGGPAPSTTSDKGPSSPAQPQEGAALGGHRARSRDRSARGG